MIDKLPLGIVTERDIDILILEELIAEEKFAREFLAALSPMFSCDWTISGAWHSVSVPVLGETDIVALCQLPIGKTHAFLIENKIDAPPQPDQAARYQQRGALGQKSGDWDCFTSCLIAPEKYLSGVGDVKGYEAKLSYEWIAENLGGVSGEKGRLGFKRNLLLQAIEQNRRGYSPKHDERVTAFQQAYWSVLREHFPELGMKEPVSKPAGSDWIELRPAFVPEGCTVIHKLESGAVDLQTPFPAAELGSFSSALRDFLHDDMVTVATGKSCSVRLNVPQVDRFKDFNSQREECLVGIRAAYRIASVATIATIKPNSETGKLP